MLPRTGYIMLYSVHYCNNSPSGHAMGYYLHKIAKFHLLIRNMDIIIPYNIGLRHNIFRPTMLEKRQVKCISI